MLYLENKSDQGNFDIGLWDLKLQLKLHQIFALIMYRSGTKNKSFVNTYFVLVL